MTTQELNDVPLEFDDALAQFYVSLGELRLVTNHAASYVAQYAPKIARASSPDFTEYINSISTRCAPLLLDVNGCMYQLRNSVEVKVGSDVGECEDVDNVSSVLVPEFMIWRDCCDKARREATACLMMSTLCTVPEDDDDDDDNSKDGSHDCISSLITPLVDSMLNEYSGPLPDGPEVQAAVAHIVEEAISTFMFAERNDEVECIFKVVVSLYTCFQRQTLRARSKPAIANLVSIRRAAAKFGDKTVDNVGDAEDMKARQPHVHAITNILSSATILLQPIRGWYEALQTDGEERSFLLQMLKLATNEIDQEAQDLSCTVGNWFTEDRQLETWVSNALMYMSQNPQHEQPQTAIDVSGLDNTLEELAFVCQVSARYCEFINTIKDKMSSTPFPSHISESANEQPLYFLLKEHSAQYAALEDCLSKSSLDRAVEIAAPVEIEDKRFVPSVVEDAFSVSRKAIERAASTFNSNALDTLACRIYEAWGPEGGIYRAVSYAPRNELFILCC